MKLLAPAVGTTLPDAFFAGDEPAQVEQFTTSSGREIPTDDVVEVLLQAAHRFENPVDSDAWVGPRLHAALRLSRREAARREMWLHLGIVDCPDYVRWRFGPAKDRYLGGPTKHGLARLWWSAELFRQGSDYGPATQALDLQEIPNTVLKLVATRNQPFCAALLQFVETRRSDHQRLIGRQINRLATAVNSQFFVAALDAVAPSAPRDPDALRVWLEHPVPIEDLVDATPLGPADLSDDPFETKVEAVLALLHHVADSAGIAPHGAPRAGSKRPGDEVSDDQGQVAVPDGLVDANDLAD